MKGIRLTRMWIAALAAAIVAVSATAGAAADTLRIGAILSLTGNTSELGQSMRDGILLAAEEINRHGGVNGNRIEIALEDSRSDPAAAVEAFRKLEAKRPPLFYLSFLSSVGMALAPLADENKVALVGLVTSAAAFTRGHEYAYRYWYLAQADVPPLLLMLRDVKAKKLGILFSNEEYGRELQKLIAGGFVSAGVSVASQQFELADTDISRQLEALKDRDAIIIASLGASLANALHQLRMAKYAGSILMPSSGANPASLANPEMQDVYLSSPIIYNQAYLYARDAGEKFNARYHKSLNHWAGAGYDFVKLICGLLEDHPLTRQGVKDALSAGFDYSGVFGHVRVAPGEHDFTFSVFPARVVNNALKFR